MVGNKTPKGRLHQPWTEKEKQYLRKHYGVKNTKEIAKHLGRSPGTICQTARNMGLAKATSQYGVTMATVLSPGQCQAMRTFLAALLWAHNMNPNLNVGEFIIAYRKYIAGREEILNDVI